MSTRTRQTDVNLVIKARDEATQAISAIKDSLQGLLGSQANLARGSRDTATGLQQVVATLAGLDKAYTTIAGATDRAGDAASLRYRGHRGAGLDHIADSHVHDVARLELALVLTPIDALYVHSAGLNILLRYSLLLKPGNDLIDLSQVRFTRGFRTDIPGVYACLELRFVWTSSRLADGTDRQQRFVAIHTSMVGWSIVTAHDQERQKRKDDNPGHPWFPYMSSVGLLLRILREADGATRGGSHDRPLVQAARINPILFKSEQTYPQRSLS